MRNSSLVEWFCAENVTGLKRITEAMARNGIIKSLERGPEKEPYIRNFASAKKASFNKSKIPKCSSGAEASRISAKLRV